MHLQLRRVLASLWVSLWFSACDPSYGYPEDDADGDYDDYDPGEPPEYACHVYAPGEPSHGDYMPAFDTDDVPRSPYRISYDHDPDALVQTAIYEADETLVRVTLTGIMDVDPAQPSRPWDFHDEPVSGLGPDSFAVALDGTPASPSRVICSGGRDTPVSLVFLVDVTSTMSPVLASLHASMRDFVGRVRALGVTGKVGVVTYQAFAGVNVPFDQCPAGVTLPRAPFFAPVAFDDAKGVDRLVKFLGNLHADTRESGNLSAAIAFAANNSIGENPDGSPNVIGEDDNDPAGSAPWPVDELEGLVMFVAITDGADQGLAAGERPWVELRKSLRGRIVSTIDPGVLEDSTGGTDADIWPKVTGGFGRDTKLVDLDTGAGVPVEGVSYFDLELLLLGRGLLDVPLAPVLASTCMLEIPAATAPTHVSVSMTSAAGNTTFELRADALWP